MRVVVAALLIAGPIAVYLAVYGLALLATRPAPVSPAPATEDLGPEPPAVASVCVNQWEVTEDAAESTLLDLGARRILEFRQPGNDPMQTTVHVAQQNPSGLRPYEQRVFDRVNGLAVGGLVPLTALTFRDQKESQAWSKRITSEVMSEVVDRGLARKRFGKGLTTALVVVALVCGIAVTIAAAYFIHVKTHHTTDNTSKDSLGAGFFVLLLMVGFAVKDHGYRETPAGVEVAARWLGVRAWLRGHEAFAELPPSAVAVWDRYIGYGAAVGASRVASAVIDLGMGNRKRAWSSFGGTWHRVRVHYPRFWSRYGQNPGKLVWRGTWRTVLGFALIIFWYRVIDKAANTVAPATTEARRVNGKNVSVVVPGNATIHDAASWIKFGGLALGFALAALGIYTLVRAIVDTTTATVTGEVVWTEVWRSSSSDNSSYPVLYYLAVDDGTGDSTKAWAARPSLCTRCTPGDTVTVTVHRWSRLVTELSVDKEGGEHKLRQTLMPSTPSFAGMGGGGPMGTVTPLVSAEEASRVVGFPLTARGMALPGPFDAQVSEYAGPDGKPAMQIMRGGGMMTRIAMRRQQRHGQQGQPVPGLGDEAYGGPGVLAARVGDQSFAIHVTGQAAATPPPALYALMQSLIRGGTGQAPAPGQPAGQPAPAQAAMPGIPGMPNIPGIPAVLGAVVMADQGMAPGQGQASTPPQAPMPHAPQSPPPPPPVAGHPPATGRASVSGPANVPEQPPGPPYQG